MAETNLKTTNGHDTRGESTRSGFYFTPRVDIFETDSELTLLADVPGVAPEDVDLRFERGELILQARVKPRQRPGQALMSEYQEGDFTASSRFMNPLTAPASLPNAKTAS